MNIVIIEGLDNTGKTTVIEELISHYVKTGMKVRTFHCTKPGSDITPEQIERHMDSEYLNLIDDLIKNSNDYDMAIIDRCWYSECVYGPLYRNRSTESALAFQRRAELLLCKEFGIDKITFILLDVDDLRFCIKHEDGLSLSNKDELKIGLEQQAFRNSFEKSILTHKESIIVNDGFNFKSKDTIFNKVINNIKQNDSKFNFGRRQEF